MWKLLRSFFFLWDAEKAHYLSMDLLSIGLQIPIISYFLKKSFKPTKVNAIHQVDGLEYKNPVGLAAGFDKDGRWLELLSVLGFGFIEVGTVTPKPQYGNEKPRLFRLKKDRAIINRMGFNNAGVDALVEKLKAFDNKNKVIVGGNIGKNKLTPNENAVEDYVICFNKLFPYVDYFVVNVSSPNTPGLRSLQEKEPLTTLLTNLQNINQQKPKTKPIYLKISPDLSQETIEEIIEVVKKTGIKGIVATNTTISRSSNLKDIEISKEAGGLSGEPVKELSRSILSSLYQSYDGTIISVGGIMSSDEAIQRRKMGADLIQIYTGLIYEGPWFVKRILNYLD